MPRARSRNGYPQRTDLTARPLPATAATGQTYGKATAQIEAQRQVPMAAGPPPTQGFAPLGATPPPMGLDGPTARPGEPITAGLDIGAGPGSEVLGQIEPEDEVTAELRAIYRMFPNADLGELLEDADFGITF